MEQVEVPRRPGDTVRRWLPLVVLVAAMAAFFALGLGRYLTFQALAENREWLLAQVARSGLVAAIGYIAAYTAVAALSVPGATVLTITGGFLFGTVMGGLYALTGAVIGSAIIFSIARTSLGEPLRRRAGPFMRKLEAGFAENAWSYMLLLRLVPLFPFWLVNLVPAFLGVPLRIFVICSVFGMAPGALVYASLGQGVGAIIEKGQSPDLHVFSDWRVLAPVIGLVMLACVPVAYKWYKVRRPGTT